MFKGAVLSESLNNPTLLNSFRKIHVNIEEHPESPEIPFWHLFNVEVADEEIEHITEQLAAEMKLGWYAHFWDANVVYVVFTQKVFKLLREDRWSSPEYQEARQYGIEHGGVDERYLDFCIED
jgi:hypothetical protein